MSTLNHNYAAWIIICSGRASQAIKSLGQITLDHMKDDDAADALKFFKDTDFEASRLANTMAIIDSDPQPRSGALSKEEKISFWCDRAAKEVHGMCKVAGYLIATGSTAPVVKVVEFLEKTEAEATRLTMAVATRH